MIGAAVRDTPPERQGWFASSKGITNESYYTFTKAARAAGTNNVDNAKNNWDPLYNFSTEDVATRVNEVTVLEEMLEEINVVPNPYYAYSQYETNKLDNRVKIVNLPEVCTVRIYNLSGTLIRTYDKADPLTFMDWDLKNEANVPIAGGVYIIHIDVPGVGQAIRKWFGVMRPVDLDNF